MPKDLDRAGIPSYRELPTLPDCAERHAWNVWGRDDQLGTLNFVDAAKVAAACTSVVSGQVIPLGLPLNEPAPGLFPSRRQYEHNMISGAHGWDDRLDGFYPQFSTQFDGLRHVRYRHHGYWGGRQEEDLEHGALGIEQWARRGLVSRGVLLDAVDFFADQGNPLVPNARRALGAGHLDEIARSQGVRVTPGDVVLIRTGWLSWYRSLDDEGRDGLVGSVGRAPTPLSCPGLDSTPATAAWLWDHQVAAVAVDNPTVEVLPVEREAGFLHYRLIPLLGMALGEFWVLDELAEVCRSSGRYAFLLTSGIMDIPGGVGSPANAYAVL